jgi:serine/threonine protein phosphatase PrpC
MLKLDCYMVTDVGNIRKNNEDNFYLNGSFRTNTAKKEYHASKADLSEGIFAVCDGMGGEEYGELASLLAVETIKEHQDKERNFSVGKFVEDANHRICQMIQENKGIRSGTTFVVIDISKKNAVCYNIGDSRGYLFRNGRLTQLSEDHTMTNRLIKTGILTAEQAKTHRQRHVLTQHLGIFEDELVIEAHTSESISILPEDCFLLCSDGLTDMLTDPEIEDILSMGLSPEESAEKLRQTALAKGGKDNLTVGIIKAVEKKESLFRKLWRKA